MDTLDNEKKPLRAGYYHRMNDLAKLRKRVGFILPVIVCLTF